MRLLPPANIPSQTVFVSIAMHRSAKLAAPARDKAEQKLLRLFDRFAVPATWGLADPASELAAAVRSGGAAHEVGLLIDPNVASRRAMLRQMDSAARSGADVSTVVCDAEVSGEVGELLARRGISIIAYDRHDSRGRKSPPVTTVRFGLWQISAAGEVSSPAAGVERKLRRSIERTATAGGLLHLAVDGAAVGQSTAAASALERLLSLVSEQQAREALRIRTARQIAAQFRRRPTAGAKSILRISSSRRNAA